MGGWGVPALPRPSAFSARKAPRTTRSWTGRGRYAADWTIDALPVVARALLRRLPRPIRVRVVVRLVARLIRRLHDDGRLRALVRRGTVVVTLEGSLFCDVREPVGAPLCRFYGAVLARCLESFGMSARVQLSRCRATGDGTCEFIIHIGGRETRPSARHG